MGSLHIQARVPSGIMSGMPNLSAVELAELAGVPLAEVDHLCDLGILPEREGKAQFTEGDISRVRMAKTCETAGLPLEEIAAAIREGKLSLALTCPASDGLRAPIGPTLSSPPRWDCASPTCFPFRRRWASLGRVATI